MKHILRLTLLATLLLTLTLGGNALSAQTVRDFKVKNNTNTAERTIMLDLLRKQMQDEFAQEFKFLVDHFKVSGDWAWLRATAQRKDGKEIALDDEAAYDCCHVECLFQKVDGKWTVYRHGAFSTDVWYEGIQAESGAPAAIF